MYLIRVRCDKGFEYWTVSVSYASDNYPQTHVPLVMKHNDCGPL